MKLVILDRDGTINADSDEFIKSPEEWTPLPGALEAIARLNHAGWHTVIASNQSGLGRGLFDVASLNAMHAKMHKMLAAQGGRIDVRALGRTEMACATPVMSQEDAFLDVLDKAAQYEHEQNRLVIRAEDGRSIVLAPA